MTKIADAFWFSLLPIQRRDLTQITSQVSVVRRALAKTYTAYGLLPPGAEYAGVYEVLCAASRGWKNKWAAPLAAAWSASARRGDLGFGGRVSSTLAQVSSFSEFSRDTTALLVSWIMVLTVIFGLLWACLSGLVTSAYAATAAASNALSGDVAQNMLNDLLPMLGTGTLLAQALGKVTETLCWTCFSVAAITGMLNGGLMLIEYGTSYESASQQYSPTLFLLRALVGIGLLVPVSGGWDLAEKLMAKTFLYGSKQASTAWQKATSNLTNSDQWVLPPEISDGDAVTAISNTAAAEACAASFNLDPAVNLHERIYVNQTPQGFSYDRQVKGIVWGWNTETAGACGRISVPSTKTTSGLGTGVSEAIINANTSTFNTMRTSVAQQVQRVISTQVACRDSTKCQALPDPAVMGTIVNIYKSQLHANLVNQVSNVNAQAQSAISGANTSGGWISAGMWALQLSQFQDSLDAGAGAVPMISPPPKMNEGTLVALNWVENGLGSSSSPAIAAQNAAQGGQTGGISGWFSYLSQPIWNTMAQMDQMNPLAGLSSLGKSVYWVGTSIFVADQLLGKAKQLLDRQGVSSENDQEIKIPKVALPQIIGKFILDGAAWVAEALSRFAFPLILIGCALAYIVPALPFIRFFFSVVGWVVAIFQAIVLTPLALSTMITAEKGGLGNQTSKAAFWNIVAVVVRPLLTIAGFIIGIMMITVTIRLLNATMIPYMQGTETGLNGFFGLISDLCIYMVLAYVTVNVCSKMSEILPHAAANWMGANAGGERDDGSMVMSAIGASLTRFDRAILKPKTGKPT